MSEEKKRRNRELSTRQKKYVEARLEGQSKTDAAITAGYSAKNAGQSGYQVEKAIAGRMRELMDDVGLTTRLLIEKHLIPLLDATETKFFPWRKTTKRGTHQIIDRREVKALAIQLAALDMAFRLRGDYAPKQIDTEPDVSDEVTVINIGGIPRYNEP